MSIIPNEYNINIPNIGKITIVGFSRAGFRTGFILKPYNIYLDGGFICDIPAKLILLTHGHLDHIACVPSLLVKNINVPIIHGSNLTENLNYAVKAFYCLNNNLNSKNIKLNSLTDSKVNININKVPFFIKNYQLSHRVPCFGYGIFEVKKKLHKDFIGKNSKEIVELKKNKINIFEYIKIPIVLFLGDTDIKGLVNIDFNTYPFVIMECTFIEEEHYTEATSRGHLHWKDIEPLLKKHENTEFMLIHLSYRYKDEILTKFISEKCKIYKNLKFWFNM